MAMDTTITTGMTITIIRVAPSRDERLPEVPTPLATFLVRHDISRPREPADGIFQSGQQDAQQPQSAYLCAL